MRARTIGAALVALAPACSDGATAVPEPVPATFTVWVFEERLSVLEAERPLAGATVAADRSGIRVTGVTGADGRAVLAVDPTGGVFVSAFSPEHTLVSVADVSAETLALRPNRVGRPSSDLVIVLPPLDASLVARSVELHGAIVNRHGAGALLLTTGGIPRIGFARTTDATYAVRAPRGRPFVLLGRERPDDVAPVTFRVDVPPRDASDVLDLDLATLSPLPMTRTRLRVASPWDGATVEATIESIDSALVAGSAATTTKEDRTADLDLDATTTDLAPERLVTRATVTAPDGATSTRTELGRVPDGAVWGDFPIPFEVPEASRSLLDPLPLEGLPPDADLRIEAFAGGKLIWIVLGPTGGPRGHRLTLGTPLGIDFSADVQIVALRIESRFERVALEPSGELHRRTAASRDVLVRRR